jgi:hypothetical protein
MPEMLVRFQKWILLGFVAGSVFFLMFIDSTFNGGFYFSVTHLWLPLACVIFGYTWWHRAYFIRIKKSVWKPWFLAAVLYPVALLMIWPYLMAVNAITGTGETITFHGPIQEKRTSQGRRSTSYQVVILDQTSHERVTLKCSSSDYVKFHTGDVISRTFQVGGFGIPYRWKF